MPSNTATNIRSFLREIVVEALAGTGIKVIRYGAGSEQTLPFVEVTLLPNKYLEREGYESGASPRHGTAEMGLQLYGKVARQDDGNKAGKNMDAVADVIENVNAHLFSIEDNEFLNDAETLRIRIQSVSIDMDHADPDDGGGANSYIIFARIMYDYYRMTPAV